MGRHDITFELNNGTKYGFMLARDKGKKAWTCKRIKTIAPSLIKYRIEMTLSAKEHEANRDGGITKKGIDTFLTELETVAAETTAMTLVGLDEGKNSRSYSVLVDETGVEFVNMVEEKNRKPEYNVTLVCWGLWT